MKIFVVLAVLILMWAAAAVKVTEPKAGGSHVPVSLTPEKLSAVTEGMSIEEVTEIIGCEGNVTVDRSPATGAEVSVIQWNNNGASLRCKFKNGRLVQKYASAD